MRRLNLQRAIAIGLCCVMVFLALGAVGATSDVAVRDDLAVRHAAADVFVAGHGGVSGSASARPAVVNAQPASDSAMKVHGFGTSEAAVASELWLRAAIVPLRI